MCSIVCNHTFMIAKKRRSRIFREKYLVWCDVTSPLILYSGPVFSSSLPSLWIRLTSSDQFWWEEDVTEAAHSGALNESLVVDDHYDDGDAAPDDEEEKEDNGNGSSSGD